MAKSKQTSNAQTRKLQKPSYKSLRLHKRIRHPAEKLPSSFRLFKRSLRHVIKHWRVFLGITVVYLLLVLVLVKGFAAGTNVAELKTSLQEVFTGTAGQLTSSLALLSVLIGDAGSASSDVANAYQSVLLVLASLAIIWALRQTHAANKVTVKDSFYKGMYPLIPFLLVLFVIGLQFIPLLVGNFIYGIVIGNGLAVSGAEKVIWALLFFLLALLTFYMVSSSVFALYIVTLPDRLPLQSLRSAREVVRYRRWTVLRKVLFLPVLLLLGAVVIMLPVILWLTIAASWIFFILSTLALVVAHSYLYTLYRELL